MELRGHRRVAFKLTATYWILGRSLDILASMMGEAARNLIWESLFMADVRGRYFAHIAGRNRAWDRRLAIAVGVLSSTSVASILANIPHAPLVLSLATAVLGTTLAALKLDKRVSVGASISRQWMEIASEYEIMWAEIDSMTEKAALKRHRELEKKHLPVDELAIAEFPLRKTLLDLAFRETSYARGVVAEHG